MFRALIIGFFLLATPQVSEAQSISEILEQIREDAAKKKPEEQLRVQKLIIEVWKSKIASAENSLKKLDKRLDVINLKIDENDKVIRALHVELKTALAEDQRKATGY